MEAYRQACDYISNIVSNPDNSFYNHLENEPIKKINGKFVSTFGPVSTDNVLARIAHYASYSFPILTIFHKPTGLFVRSCTDFVQLRESRQSSPQFLLSSMKISLSIAALFSSYGVKEIELCRSIIFRCETIYRNYQDPSLDQWGWKIRQQILHLIIDATNIGLYFRSSVHLRMLSHTLQLVASVIDFLEQKFHKSHIGMGVESLLGLARFASFIATGKELYHSLQPHSLGENERLASTQTIRPNQVSATLEEFPSVVYQPGTGSEELSKLQVIQYLGKDGITSEKFLVKDENGNILLLKRFFSDSEKIAQSTLYTFMYVLTFPIQLVKAFMEDIRVTNCKTALDISQNSSDQNMIKVYKLIENKYEVLKEGTIEKMPHHDVYLLTEYFKGTPIEELGSSAKEYVYSIAKTIAHLSGMNYFYQADDLKDIHVDETNYRLKFLSFENFKKIQNNSWENCLTLYGKLYNFFLNLVNLCNEEQRAHILTKLNEIFNYQNLVEQFEQTKSGSLSEDLKKKLSETFNTELLKSVLNQVAELLRIYTETH